MVSFREYKVSFREDSVVLRENEGRENIESLIIEYGKGATNVTLDNAVILQKNLSKECLGMVINQKMNLLVKEKKSLRFFFDHGYQSSIT